MITEYTSFHFRIQVHTFHTYENIHTRAHTYSIGGYALTSASFCTILITLNNNKCLTLFFQTTYSLPDEQQFVLLCFHAPHICFFPR